MEQLNKLYCAQSHFQERFSEIIDDPAFADLHIEMMEGLQAIELQTADTQEIYKLLNRKYSFDKCDTMLEALENYFDKVQQDINVKRLRDMALFNYIQTIQNLTNAAFQMLAFRQTCLDGKVAELLTKNTLLVPAQSLKQLLMSRLTEASKQTKE